MQQELLQKGLLSNMNFLVPSYAHDDVALAETCDVFERSLKGVMEARKEDRFASRLEILPVHV